jgi:hypothetical protein
MSLTLSVETAARNFRRRRTALLQRSQVRRGGVEQRLLLLPLDGVVLRRRPLVAVGEVLLRPGPVEEAVEEEALGGVRVQVLGHHPQQEGGVPTQRQVRGVQEAAAGEQAAAQLETPVGAVPIHRRRKAAQAGTCDTRTGSIIS